MRSLPGFRLDELPDKFSHANLGLLVTHSYDRKGRISFVDSVPVEGAELPCWASMVRESYAMAVPMQRPLRMP